jgi:hypothetical protein
MVVGAYVGCATVGAFVVWYLCDSFLGIDLSQVRCSKGVWVHTCWCFYTCWCWSVFPHACEGCGIVKRAHWQEDVGETLCVCACGAFWPVQLC